VAVNVFYIPTMAEYHGAQIAFFGLPFPPSSLVICLIMSFGPSVALQLPGQSLLCEECPYIVLIMMELFRLCVADQLTRLRWIHCVLFL